MKSLFLNKTALRRTALALMMTALAAWNFQANAAWYMHGNFPSLNGGNGNNTWALTHGLGMTQDGPNAFYAYDITFPGNDVENYYFFSNNQGTGDDNWNYFNDHNYRWGPGTDGTATNKGEAYTAAKNNTSYKWQQSDSYTCYVLYRTDNHEFVINDEIYLIGEDSGLGAWNPNGAVTLHYDRDGLYKASNVTIATDTRFCFAGDKNWQFTYRPATDNEAVENNAWVNTTLANTGGSTSTYAYTIPAGTYEVTFNIKDRKFQFNRHIDKLYVLGQVNGNDWAANVGLEMTRVSYNVFKAEHVSIADNATLSFSTVLANTADDWAAIRSGRVTTTHTDDWPVRTEYLDMTLGLAGPKTFTTPEKSFKVQAGAGYYDIDVNMNSMTVKFTARNTPWDGITYEWTDENGATNRSDLLDVATDPRHMLALFNEVYTNPNVPGQLEHNEYLLDGTKATYQRNPRVIDYNRHSYLLYGISNYTSSSPYVNFSETGLVRNCTTNPSTEYQFRTNTYPAGDRGYLIGRFTRRIPWLKINGKTVADITPTDIVPQPEQDGMTLLLVEVADEWDNRNDWNRDDMTGGGTNRPVDNNLIPITKKSLKSVRVIPQYLRVTDPDNPGYLFVIDKITAQRFFFASKGREQIGDAYGSSNSPLFTAYECIAPQNMKIDPEALRQGKVEYVQHDCYNIWQKGENDGHFIDLAGSEATTFNNLALFVPDKRFPGLDWDPTTRTINTANSAAGTGDDLTKFYHQREQNKKFRPKLLLYKAFLDAAVAETATEGIYQVTLNWNTWFDSSKLETSVNQQYYIYVQNANGEWVNVGTFHPQSGLGVGGTTQNQTLTYEIQQTDATQVLNYMVTANPINIDTTTGHTTASSIKVNTNIATVIIPGRERFLIDVADHRSRFALNTENRQLNVYRNRVVVSLNNGAPKTDEPFVLYRRSTDGDVAIANVMLSGTETPGLYSYTLNFINGTQNYSPRFAESDRDEDKVLTGTIGNGNNIECVDLFYASTETNSHPAQYTYELMRLTESRSNKYVVPVLKSATSGKLAGFTKDDVDGDTDHSLREDHEIQVTFQAQIDEHRSLEKYDVHRVDIDEHKYDYHVAKAERGNDNKISLVNIEHATGHLTKGLGIFDVLAAPEGKMNLTVYDDGEYCDLDDPHYVTEIRTVKGNEGNWVYNTYGTNVVDVEEPQMSFICNGKRRTEGTYTTDGITTMGYAADLQVTPHELPDNLQVYCYRIWRVEEDGSETLLNEVDVKDNTYTDLGELNTMWPTFNPETHRFPDVVVTDVYKASPISEDITIQEPDPDTGEMVDYTEVHSKKEVKYIARMYTSTYSNSPTGGAQYVRMRGDEPIDDANHKWYVTEKDITVVYDYNDRQQTPTGIANVNTDSRVVNVRYVNPQGMISDRPFSGINIVVVTRADGRVSTTKILR